MRSLAAYLLLVALALLVGIPRPVPRLKWRFPVDRSLRYRHTRDVEVASPIGQMTQHQVNEVSFRNAGPGPEGRTKLVATFDTLSFRMDSPMVGVLEYDSRAAGEDAGNPLASLSAFVGKPLALTVDARGEIHDLSGGDAVRDAFAADNPIAVQLRSMASDAMLRGELAQILARLPAHEPKVGETWTASRTGGAANLPVTLELHFALTGVEETGDARVGTVEFVAPLEGMKLDPSEADPDNPMAAMLSQVEISGGEVKGVARFDMTERVLLSSRTETVVKMSMMGIEIETRVTDTTERIR